MPRLDPYATEWRLVDGEVLGLDLRTEEYFSLTGSAVPLWQALSEGASDEALAALLVERFGIDRAAALEDVATFVGSLAARGLLTE